MSDLLNTLLSTVNVDALQDQTVAKAAYEYKIPDAGITTARFFGYIELGSHPEFYQGKEKDHPAPYARLLFELLGPKYVTTDENGNKRTTVFSVDVTIKTDEKAKFRKLFMKMRGGRDNIKHMAQMLGEGFIVKIVHNSSGEGDKKKTYANIYSAGEWLVFPPVKEDPLSGEVEVLNVPAMTQQPKLFLFNQPSKEQWDSIFIDGEYEREVDGVKKTFSKNVIQRRIFSAKNFAGSAVEDLLSGIGDLDLLDDTATEDGGPIEDQADAPETPPPAPKASAKVEPAPAKEKPASAPEKPAPVEPRAAPQSETDIDDLFADLGIKA